MKRYTVTVTPDDHNEATATIRYELNGGAPRVTHFALTAADDQSLSAAQMLAVDVAKLLDAIRLTTTKAPSRTVGPAARTRDIAAPVVDHDDAATDNPPAAAKQTGAEAILAEEPLAPRTRAPRANAVKAAPATKTPAVKKDAAAKKAPAKSPAAKAAAVKPPAVKASTVTGRKSATATTESSGTRARRLMPDDFPEVYRQASTVTAVADFYNVPQHTAQGWVKTARKRNLIDPARSRKRA